MNVEPETPQPETDAPTQKPSRRPGLPSWTLGLLILALTAVLVWAGNAFIRSRQQLPGPAPRQEPSASSAPSATPTPRTSAPTATPPATLAEAAPAEPDETLILVADLYSLSGGDKPDASLTQRFYETLAARIEEDILQGRMRAERLDEMIADAEAARAAGRAQNAGFVLWNSAPKPGTDTTFMRISLIRVNTQPQTRTTPQGYDLTLTVLSHHDLQTSSSQENWVDGAVDMFLALAAYGQIDVGEEHPLWNQALKAAQEAEVPELTADLLLYQGNTRAFEGDYEGALAEYDAAIAAAPDAAPAYVNRGSVRAAQGNEDGALDDLNRALEIDPEAADAYYVRSTFYRAQGQKEEMLADLNQAVALDPEHARAYASRALVYHNAGNHEAALADYTRAIELAPASAEVYLNRGGTYATLNQFEAALADYTRAIELNPDDADAYYNRGTVYAMLEAYDQSLADLNRALALRPDFAQIYGNRGLVYKAMGETDKAIADLEHFLDLTDNPQWRQMIEQQLAELKSE